MVIEVRIYTRWSCPRCPYAADREDLRRHAWNVHGGSLVGVPIMLAASGWDVTLRAAGRWHVVDIVDPKVVDLGLGTEAKTH